MLSHLIAPCYAQVDSAFSNKRGDIGGREEDKRERQVLDEGDVEARVAVELDVRAVKEVKAGFVKPALCAIVSRRIQLCDVCYILFGTANSSRSFKLFPRVSVSIGRALLPWRGLVSIPATPFVPF
jgi:hypothetical protein